MCKKGLNEMTVLIYQTDSYVREFEAQVTGHDLEQNGIYLDRDGILPRRRRSAARFGALAGR